MIGWKKYCLADLGEFKNGVNFSTDKMGSGIALINVKDITDSPLLHPERLSLVDIDLSKKTNVAYLADEGDIFFVRSSVKREGVGAVGMLKNNIRKVVHCGFVIRYRIQDKETDQRFLFYLLDSPFYRETVRGLSGGATIVNISQESLKKVSIYKPELPTQKRIASILSAYDDLIENNLKRIKLLEELAQRTYEEWFVKFRINGEHLTIDEKTGLPEGWERKSLSAIGDITSSKRIFLSEYVENGIPFYRSKEIIQKYNFENVDSPLFITEKKYYEIKNKFGEPKQGDFLITAVGTLGYVHLVNEKDGEFYFKDGNLIWIKNIKNKLLIPMMFFRFRSSEFKNYLNSIAIGSSQKALTIESMKRIEIVIPTKEIQLSFDFIANPLLNQIYNIATQNQKLKESRDILLPKLMNGTLNIES